MFLEEVGQWEIKIFQNGENAFVLSIQNLD